MLLSKAAKKKEKKQRAKIRKEEVVAEKTSTSSESPEIPFAAAASAVDKNSGAAEASATSLPASAASTKPRPDSDAAATEEKGPSESSVEDSSEDRKPSHDGRGCGDGGGGGGGSGVNVAPGLFNDFDRDGSESFRSDKSDVSSFEDFLMLTPTEQFQEILERCPFRTLVRAAEQLSRDEGLKAVEMAHIKCVWMKCEIEGWSESSFDDIIFFPPDRQSAGTVSEQPLSSEDNAELIRCTPTPFKSEAVKAAFTDDRGKFLLGADTSWSAKHQRIVEALMHPALIKNGIQPSEFFHCNIVALYANLGTAAFEGKVASGVTHSKTRTTETSRFASKKLKPRDDREAASEEADVAQEILPVVKSPVESTTNIGGAVVAGRRPLSVTELKARDRNHGCLLQPLPGDGETGNIKIEREYDAFEFLGTLTAHRCFEKGLGCFTSLGLLTGRKFALCQKLLFDLTDIIFSLFIEKADSLSAAMAIAQSAAMTPNGQATNHADMARLPSTIHMYLENRGVDTTCGTHALRLLKKCCGDNDCTAGVMESKKVHELVYDHQGGFQFAAMMQDRMIHLEETAQMFGGGQHPASFRFIGIWLLVGNLNIARNSSDSKFSQGDKTAVAKLNALFRAGKLNSWNSVHKFLGEQAEKGNLVARDGQGFFGQSSTDFADKPDALSYYHGKGVVAYKKILQDGGLDWSTSLQRVNLPTGQSLRLKTHVNGDFVLMPTSLKTNQAAREAYHIALNSVAPEIDGKPNPKFNKDVVDAPVVKTPAIDAQQKMKAKQQAKAKLEKQAKVEKEKADEKAQKVALKAVKEKTRQDALQKRRDEEKEVWKREAKAEYAAELKSKEAAGASDGGGSGGGGGGCGWPSGN